MKQLETKGTTQPIPGRVPLKYFSLLKSISRQRKVSWSVVLTEAIECYLKKLKRL